MTDAAEKYCVLLHVVEGVGLNSKGEPIILNGTLNGIKYEVEGLNAEATTIFNSNFIWEHNLGEIKKMKTDNRPVKLEVSAKCLNGTRKPIGFVLLPIRQLQFVSNIRQAQIKLHWHKIGGLSAEYKLKKPELYLFLMIVKKTLIDSGQFDALVAPKSTESTESFFIRPSETSLMLTSQHGIYIKVLEDERLIQVGNTEDDSHIFIAILTFRNAKNLEELINPEDKQSSLFRFHYDLFGTPSSLAMSPKGNGVYSIQEKISISFKTSLTSLKQYFKTIFYIPIDLYYNDSIIGNYRFDFSHLIKAESVTDFQMSCLDNTVETKGSFLIETVFEVLSNTKPSVEYMFSLKYMSASQAKKCEVVHDLPQMVEYIDIKAGGDIENPVFELPPTEIDEKSVLDLPMRHVQSDSCLTISSRGDQHHHMTAKETKSDVGINCVIEQDFPTGASMSLGNQALEEEIGYKIINELEDWKHSQMEHFLLELKRKEVAHLSHLSAEWQKQKYELQSKMETQLEECARLTESLDEAQQLVQEKGVHQLEQERILDEAKHELDKKYSIKFIEINEKARRVADDMEHKIKLEELRYKELEISRNSIEKENEKLKEEIAELNETLNDMRKTYLSKEQLAGVFQDLKTHSERLLEMEKSKNFYKEQWAKIVREVHKMKLENLQWQEHEIKQSQSFGLKKIIHDEQTELLTDRQELNSIKHVLESDSEDDSESSSLPCNHTFPM